jgi:hypothetical protein
LVAWANRLRLYSGKIPNRFGHLALANLGGDA